MLWPCLFSFHIEFAMLSIIYCKTKLLLTSQESYLSNLKSGLEYKKLTLCKLKRIKSSVQDNKTSSFSYPTMQWHVKNSSNFLIIGKTQENSMALPTK